MKSKLLLTIIALAVLTTLSLAHAQGAYTLESPTTGTTTRVSVASDGTQGDNWSGSPAMSADGRYVAFRSASNLVPGDTNGYHDIYVHDRQTGNTTRVSVASDGTQGNEGSGVNPAISADGRYVAFISLANNLVPGDTNGWFDVFVHDRQTGDTTRVSVASDGTQGNGSSATPAISADGRYVAFFSYAFNLVPGDNNLFDDIFVHDTQTGQTTRVSVASDGTQGNDNSAPAPAISADGRYVAFSSLATNLVPGDTDGYYDIFVHDRQTGQTARVSVASDGTQGNESSGLSAISADGRYVAFDSYASNLATGDANGYKDVFVHDRQTSQTTRVSVASDGTQGNGASGYRHAISGDGRYVAFSSEASNLVPGDANGYEDVFVHDTQTGQTSRVSVASDGTQGNGTSGYGLAISGDGCYVAFSSEASNLVPGDTNDYEDVFVHDQGIESEAKLTINYSDGAPGSYFTVTGSGFPANATATISVNGHELGTVPVDTMGGFTFLFSTANADEGIYMITASVNPSATTQLILDAAQPIRPQEGTGSIIDIPEGIAFTNQIFLPLLQRQIITAMENS
jgi:Tol biopolymer transport system component